MTRAYDTSAHLLQTGELQTALNEFAALPKQPKFRAKGMLSMVLLKCPACENRLIKLLAQKRVGNRYAKLGEVKVPTAQPVTRPMQVPGTNAK